MKRRTSTAPVRVYDYGCSHRGVISNRALVDDQYRKAHTYQQTLVEMELKRRTAVRAALAEAPDVIAPAAVVTQLVADLQQAREAVNVAKRVSRSNRVPVELKGLIAELRLKLKPARDTLKLAKQAAAKNVDTKTKLTVIEEAHRTAAKAARAACGVYWGSYLQVERSVEQQRKGVHDPRRRDYDGSGRIAVQIQKGMTVAELFGGEDRRVQLRPTGTGSLTSQKNHVCKLRVGTEPDGRTPIWAEIEVAIHRPLPSDAKVMWVVLHRLRRGLGFRYRLQVTFEAMSLARTATGNRRVAVDLGWRVFASGNEGLRVAYWHDSTDTHGELRLPPRLVSALDYPAQLIGVEEKWFEGAKVRMADWQDAHTLPPEHVEWLSNLRQWRSGRRLAGYVWWWREHRFAGDDEIFAAMNEWRVRRFWHYRNWSIAQRDQAIARRLDYYRVFAAHLLEGCNELVLEDFDLRVFARKREDTPPAVRFWQHMAAPTYLRGALVNRASGQGIKVTIVDPAMTTRRCYECGSELPWDQKQLVHTCEKCGATWDQDANAGKNILASGPVTSDPLEALADGEIIEENIEDALHDSLDEDSENGGARKRGGKI